MVPTRTVGVTIVATSRTTVRGSMTPRKAMQRPVPIVKVQKLQPQGGTMNWDVIEGRWQEMKGKLKTKWAKLTDDDLDAVGGKRVELLGRLQQRYGYKKDEAEQHLDDWMKSVSEPQPDSGSSSKH
jgi:uncharacterized protein YjbJ (UPF0337 family)